MQTLSNYRRDPRNGDLWDVPQHEEGAFYEFPNLQFAWGFQMREIPANPAEVGSSHVELWRFDDRLSVWTLMVEVNIADSIVLGNNDFAVNYGNEGREFGLGMVFVNRTILGQKYRVDYRGVGTVVDTRSVSLSHLDLPIGTRKLFRSLNSFPYSNDSSTALNNIIALAFNVFNDEGYLGEWRVVQVNSIVEESDIAGINVNYNVSGVSRLPKSEWKLSTWLPEPVVFGFSENRKTPLMTIGGIAGAYANGLPVFNNIFGIVDGVNIGIQQRGYSHILASILPTGSPIGSSVYSNEILLERIF